MPKARKQQVSLDHTRHYHCISRCVRRSFLCGKDQYSGKCYEHRRRWVEDRLLCLAKVFAVDVQAYAVMSNHTHVVLYIDLEAARAWEDLEVISRWHQLFSGTSLTRRFADSERRGSMEPWELDLVRAQVDLYRARLADISWFMRALNEYIARKANREDECTGRFWEGRFRSQALLDEQALLSCMAYVDLNPIRSGIAQTPVSSKHTSIRRRIRAAEDGKQPSELRCFASPKSSTETIPCHLNDYLELVDVTARVMTKGKGHLPALSPPLLQRLDVDFDCWLELTQGFEYQFSHYAGRVESLRRCGEAKQIQRVRGTSAARRLFG
ncbi:transposase [Ferrimonas sediminicola]|uniref:Transposase n=1 Tax=Ferrimonas sediminicola TaxID=2569538 RepID=A0A4U1BC18_9GAMM|nr:transposase [Ferrimonas sediminicola]TKB48492.1 transposase [Ferrimonas sediminicola]